MQMSLTTLALSGPEHSLPIESVCCKETIHRQQKGTQQTTSMSICNQPTAIINIVGVTCTVIIISLFMGAFSEETSPEHSNGCGVCTAMETSQTIATFLAGWILCLVAKRRHDLLKAIVCSTDQLLDLISSWVSIVAATVSLQCRSTGGWLASQRSRITNIAAMAMVGTVCSGGIIGLFFSAFTAVPDEELSDSGFDSEASSSIKAFTLGWIIMLSFKVRHELGGVIGLSCLLQPC